ncbi:hypothetical protein ykris0001_11030 [Yersinia kristensenii ATCC 33638]|nr:hypothetical protein ykris0001_11030 [Yersinia kristensenii ATCC 33638]
MTSQNINKEYFMIYNCIFSRYYFVQAAMTLGIGQLFKNLKI